MCVEITEVSSTPTEQGVYLLKLLGGPSLTPQDVFVSVVAASFRFGCFLHGDLLR